MPGGPRRLPGSTQRGNQDELDTTQFASSCRRYRHFRRARRRRGAGRAERWLLPLNHAPFEFKNESGVFEGFEVDIVNEAAKRAA